MAELIGDAYIRVTTDNTAARLGAHRAGREAGDEYSSAFGQEVEASIERDLAGARRKLADAFAKVDFGDFEKKSDSVAQAVIRIRGELDKMRREGDLNTAGWEHFNDVLQKWAGSAVIEERAKRDSDAMAKLRREVEAAHTEALKLNRVFDNEDFDFRLHNAALEAARFNRALEGTNRIRFGDQFQRAEVSITKLRQGLDGTDALIFKNERDTDRFHTALRRTESAGHGIFSVFGGISKSLEGIQHRGNPLVDLFTAPLRAGAQLGALFEKLFQGPLAKLTGGGGVLGLFGTLASTISASVVAVLAMIKVASLLSSALSLVAGGATIAASAIGGALAGGLLAAAGAVPAVAAGLGGLLLFMKDFSKEAPRATQAAKDFGNAFRTAFDKTAFAGVDQIVVSTLNRLAPLMTQFATRLGASINSVFRSLAAALNDPAFLRAFTTILGAIPRQVQLLGTSLVNFGAGLVSFFAPVMPFATRLLEAVLRISQAFRDWASSVSGQNQIATWMDRLFTAAASLWRTLVNVGRAIGGIFKAAFEGGTAQRFLDFLEHISKGFADFINSPQGQNQLKAWFDDAFRAGQGLGELIRGIADIFGALDTSKARQQVGDALSTVGNWLQRAAPAISTALDFVDRLTSRIGSVNWQPFIDLFKELFGFIGQVASSLQGDALSALDVKFDGFQELSDTIRDDLLPALKDFLPVIRPVVEFLGSSSLKALAESFKGSADLISGVTTALSGFLNIITGLATLDPDKILQGMGQLGEGIAKALFGGMNAALAGAGPLGIFDKIFGTSQQKFDEVTQSFGDFFSSTSTDATTWATGLETNLDTVWSNITSGLETARLAVGQWFTDTFGNMDFESVRLRIGQFFTDLGTQFATDFEAGRLAIGQFFTDLGTTIGSSLETARLAVGQFFTDLPAQIGEFFSGLATSIGTFFSELPNNLAFALGALAGMFVNSIVVGWTTAVDYITQVVFPFFAALPGQLEAFLDARADIFLTWLSNAWTNVANWFATVVFPFFAALPGQIEAFLDARADMFVTWLSGMWAGVQAWFSTVLFPFFAALPGQIEAFLDAKADMFVNWLSAAWAAVGNFFTATVFPFFQQLPGRVEAFLDEKTEFVRQWLINSWNSAFSYVENTVIPFFRNLPTTIANAFTSGKDWLLRFVQDSWSNAANWWNSTAMPWFAALPGRIVGFFANIGSTVGTFIVRNLKAIINGLIAQINSAIAGFNAFSPFDIGTLSYLARGGLVTRPTMAMIGEAGPELVIPLDRPLSQIDESVRALAAIAQGKTSYASGGVAGGRSVVVAADAIRVMVPNADPRQVASAVVDRIAAGVLG